MDPRRPDIAQHAGDNPLHSASASDTADSDDDDDDDRSDDGDGAARPPPPSFDGLNTARAIRHALAVPPRPTAHSAGRAERGPSWLPRPVPRVAGRARPGESGMASAPLAPLERRELPLPPLLGPRRPRRSPSDVVPPAKSLAHSPTLRQHTIPRSVSASSHQTLPAIQSPEPLFQPGPDGLAAAEKPSLPPIHTHLSRMAEAEAEAEVHGDAPAATADARSASRAPPSAQAGRSFSVGQESMLQRLMLESAAHPCPFCGDDRQRYTRPDELQRHLRDFHPEQKLDDASSLEPKTPRLPTGLGPASNAGRRESEGRHWSSGPSRPPPSRSSPSSPRLLPRPSRQPGQNELRRPEPLDGPTTLLPYLSALSSPERVSLGSPSTVDDRDTGPSRSPSHVTSPEQIVDGQAGSTAGAQQRPAAPSGGALHRCTFPGCSAAPFGTSYLLSSHAKVHSRSRPFFCNVVGCPRSVSGEGFKRKNEMKRHRLVHESPGYVCPFCLDREHRYPRPDNLQRHVKANHVDKSANDPRLLDVLARQMEGRRERRSRVAA